MSQLFLIAVIISLSLGILLFFVDYFKGYKKINIDKSVIAGISLVYFFLVVLPEIAEGLPEYPLHISNFKFMFVLFGFTFHHIVEKLILQKVEAKSQQHARELKENESKLKIVERNLESHIDSEILEENSDIFALRELAQTVIALRAKELDIKNKINEEEERIKFHIVKDLEELRFYVKFFYHFFIGLLVFCVILTDIVSGILLFIFAFFMAIIMNRTDTETIYDDLRIEIHYEGEPKVKRIIIAISSLLGIILGIIFEFFYPLSVEFIYLLYSFIAGVIMYIIIREILPEREKGNPKSFIISFVLFMIFVLILNIIEHKF
ncbi:MAG: hypothetical protein GF364_12195 [Candidatus Lokiarchaeota archaeon]|nr:hypothetical protein [Candidatus Lokiarchaeota archaeon]